MKPWSAAYLRGKVEAALDQAEYDRALVLIRDAVTYALRAAGRFGQLTFGSQELDSLCLEVGRRIAGSSPWRASTSPPDSERPLDLFVASEIYATGGHTGLLGDYMANLEGRRRMLAVTDFANRPRQFISKALPRLGIAPDEMMVCDESTLEGKCRWLMDLYATQRPDRVFLFTHAQDSPAAAACQPLWGSRFYFVHHADRSPSLGAFSPACVHVDVTPFCLRCCSIGPERRENIYLPIVAADQGPRDFSRSKPGTDGLLTAACASSNKFRLERSNLYIRAVVAILSATNGRHLHIGDLSDGQLFALRSELRANGIAPERFTHISFTPSLWRTLADQGVDLYIGSIPDRGARASVEAMGSGTPAIWHLSGERRRFHDLHMKYPEAAVWGDFGGLSALVRGIDGAWLSRQSAAARRHYERHHHPRLLARQLALPVIAGMSPQETTDGLDEPKPIRLDDLPVSLRDRLHASLAANGAFWRGRIRSGQSRARRLPTA